MQEVNDPSVVRFSEIGDIIDCLYRAVGQTVRLTFQVDHKLNDCSEGFDEQVNLPKPNTRFFFNSQEVLNLLF